MSGGIVICRQASDPLKPGSVYGYSCRVCTKELQVTPVGREGIEKGLIPFCNPCGFAMQQRLADAGVPHDVMFTPAAEKQMAEILAELRKK